MYRIRHGSLARAGALLPAALLTALLAACGGGGADTTPRANVSRVSVMGDSLTDVGTFGFKFTVQGADSALFTERVPEAYGLGRGCNFYAATGPNSFVNNPKAGCRNFGIGGGRINGAGGGFAPTDKRVVNTQMADAKALGTYGDGDMVVIDGGGNDAADLVGAYLLIASSGPGTYLGLLGTQLTPAQVQAAGAGGQAGLASAGGQYMTALADTFVGQIKSNVLDAGASRVVIVNIPTITNTPRFQLVLDSVGAAQGAAGRAAAETLFRGWVAAFNTELASKFAGDARVAVVDAATIFDQQVTNPPQFTLTNVKTPACPITGLGGDGLPTYTFAACTDASLSAKPPAGSTDPNWWKSYLFSDGFHPTPYGHQLLYQLIAKSLAIAGWL